MGSSGQAPIRLSRTDYTLGWICPLEVEQIAALEMLDEEHESLPQSPMDPNIYNLGSINGHNIVILGLHQTGSCPAAMAVTLMRITFPNVVCGLLVGIGGGVPRVTDDGPIRLGHVVVGKPAGTHPGVIQYDLGKAKYGDFERTGYVCPPPVRLLNAAQALAVQRARAKGEEDPITMGMRRIRTSLPGLRRFEYPGSA